jgi:DtxR family Mn-dependent transcriptional regulator
LNELGLVNYKIYGDITLTEKGINLAKEILKRFDIVKLFLTEILRVPEKQAQKDAEAMKTSISKQTENELEKYIIKVLKLDDLECGCNMNNEKCRKCARITAENRLKKGEI